MAISTYSVKLWHRRVVGASSISYQEMSRIKDYPDLGQSAPGLDSTTTSDPARTFIGGIGETPSTLEFTANYDYNTYDTLLDYADGTDREWSVTFQHQNGIQGQDGEFVFTGYLDVYVRGGGVNEVAEMVISITPSSPIAMYKVLISGSHGMWGNYNGTYYPFEDYGITDVSEGDTIDAYFEYAVVGEIASGNNLTAGINKAPPTPGPKVVNDLAATPSGSVQLSYTLTAEEAEDSTKNFCITLFAAVGRMVRIQNVRLTHTPAVTEEEVVPEEPSDGEIPVETAG